MTGLKPKNAIKLGIVNLDKSEKDPDENILPKDGLYRYWYQVGEQHGDQKRRATDFNWSKNAYRLDQALEQPGNHILCYLQDGPTELWYVKN